MKTGHVKFRRAPETNFLSVDLEVFDNLSPYALKVYGQLRKLTSYIEQNDKIQVTVKNLAIASGISERKTYDVLNELEFTHYIIQRHESYHARYGQINSIDVSQTYQFYKPQTQPTPTSCENPVNNYGQFLSTTAYCAVPPAYSAGTTAQAAYLKEQESFHESFKKKQNTVIQLSVFSDTQSVKTQIEKTLAKREVFIENEIIDQGIYYAYETNGDKSFDSVCKRINIFLKKVREGTWLIPQNYKGVSTQSIREKEELEQQEKRLQYQQEAQSAKNIYKAVAKGSGFEGFRALVKQIKGDVNGKDTDDRRMQKKVV